MLFRAVARLVCLLVVSLLLTYTSVFAQTGTRTISWQQPNLTLAEVEALVYTTQVDSDPPVVAAQTCTAGTPVSCSAPISFASGPHTITLTATNAFGSSSASISGAPPGPPVTVTITIQVTVP